MDPTASVHNPIFRPCLEIRKILQVIPRETQTRLRYFFVNSWITSRSGFRDNLLQGTQTIIRRKRFELLVFVMRLVVLPILWLLLQDIWMALRGHIDPGDGFNSSCRSSSSRRGGRKPNTEANSVSALILHVLKTDGMSSELTVVEGRRRPQFAQIKPQWEIVLLIEELIQCYQVVVTGVRASVKALKLKGVIGDADWCHSNFKAWDDKSINPMRGHLDVPQPI
eukprot:IDg10106t1